MLRELVCKTEKDTAKLACEFAKTAKKGDVFALYGTLGMGKSVFARAFIQALCDVDDVPSPTFTLLQTYSSPKGDIYHFDLYRLKHPDEVFELGFEDALYNGITLIEWPENAGGWLPKNIIKISIVSHETGRLFTIETLSEEQATKPECVR
ncbi:MAG: tRNA (adenosine(37)-N6)-threonylcarbamoyltransferase complex ATPase subunit type 1 TsaE [Alphaproteobacteria bacterium]|nr:tRNA (adenosine(37)-N6)-threonylcarbamoyltransferase complex ATPase subunit type 1 TsaE [Alphaproteobacteria bacterium]